LEEEKAQKRGKVYNWETAKYGKIWYDEDVHDHRSVETEFPAIAFTDQISPKKTISCEPTVSSLNNEIDFRVSFDDSDDEDYMVSIRRILRNGYGVSWGMDTAYRLPVQFLGPSEGKSTNVSGEFTNLEILKRWSLEASRRLFNTDSCSINSTWRIC
ncbi:hypothetical protein Tco_1340384, partial [Tanacetum coccineum]